MEHARITLITAHAAILTVIHHVITGGTTSIQINIPLKIVAITANLTGIARLTTDRVNVLLVAILGLALSNRACATLMSSLTMSTNARATRRTNPGRLDIVQVTAGMLNILTHVHNFATGINTEALNDANLIATADSLAVTIAISGRFVTGHDLIHGTHVGRVAQQVNLAIVRAGPKHLRGVRQTRSYSKATTSILMQATLLSPSRAKPAVMHILPSRHRQRNAMSHAFPMAAY